MANDIVVYGLKGSPFVRKVMVALDEKGVDFDLEAVNIYPAPDWYAEISPLKRMPAFRDRSVGTEGKAGTLADSSVICAYLERRFPEPALYPSNDYDFGRALWFEEYADTEMAAKIGLGMFRPTIVRQLLGQEPDYAKARKTLTEECPPIFDYLNGELRKDAYAVGSAFSIADIALGMQLMNLTMAGGVIEGGRWPHLAGYRDFILARPTFARRFQDEAGRFPKVDLGL